MNFLASASRRHGGVANATRLDQPTGRRTLVPGIPPALSANIPRAPTGDLARTGGGALMRTGQNSRETAGYFQQQKQQAETGQIYSIKETFPIFLARDQADMKSADGSRAEFFTTNSHLHIPKEAHNVHARLTSASIPVSWDNVENAFELYVSSTEYGAITLANDADVIFSVGKSATNTPFQASGRVYTHHDTFDQWLSGNKFYYTMSHIDSIDMHQTWNLAGNSPNSSPANFGVMPIIGLVPMDGETQPNEPAEWYITGYPYLTDWTEKLDQHTDALAKPHATNAITIPGTPNAGAFGTLAASPNNRDVFAACKSSVTQSEMEGQATKDEVITSLTMFMNFETWCGRSAAYRDIMFILKNEDGTQYYFFLEVNAAGTSGQMGWTTSLAQATTAGEAITTSFGAISEAPTGVNDLFRVVRTDPVPASEGINGSVNLCGFVLLNFDIEWDYSAQAANFVLRACDMGSHNLQRKSVVTQPYNDVFANETQLNFYEARNVNELLFKTQGDAKLVLAGFGAWNYWESLLTLPNEVYRKAVLDYYRPFMSWQTRHTHPFNDMDLEIQYDQDLRYSTGYEERQFTVSIPSGTYALGAKELAGVVQTKINDIMSAVYSVENAIEVSALTTQQSSGGTTFYNTGFTITTNPDKVNGLGPYATSDGTAFSRETDPNGITSPYVSFMRRFNFADIQNYTHTNMRFLGDYGVFWDPHRENTNDPLVETCNAANMRTGKFIYPQLYHAAAGKIFIVDARPVVLPNGHYGCIWVTLGRTGTSFVTGSLAITVQDFENADKTKYIELSTGAMSVTATDLHGAVCYREDIGTIYFIASDASISGFATLRSISMTLDVNGDLTLTQTANLDDGDAKTLPIFVNGGNTINVISWDTTNERNRATTNEPYFIALAIDQGATNQAKILYFNWNILGGVIIDRAADLAGVTQPVSTSSGEFCTVERLEGSTHEWYITNPGDNNAGHTVGQVVSRINNADLSLTQTRAITGATSHGYGAVTNSCHLPSTGRYAITYSGGRFEVVEPNQDGTQTVVHLSADIGTNFDEGYCWTFQDHILGTTTDCFVTRQTTITATTNRVYDAGTLDLAAIRRSPIFFVLGDHKHFPNTALPVSLKINLQALMAEIDETNTQEVPEILFNFLDEPNQALAVDMLTLTAAQAAAEGSAFGRSTSNAVSIAAGSYSTERLAATIQTSLRATAGTETAVVQSQGDAMVVTVTLSTDMESGYPETATITAPAACPLLEGSYVMTALGPTPSQISVVIPLNLSVLQNKPMVYIKGDFANSGMDTTGYQNKILDQVPIEVGHGERQVVHFTNLQNVNCNRVIRNLHQIAITIVDETGAQISFGEDKRWYVGMIIEWQQTVDPTTLLLDHAEGHGTVN